ncbi:MAG: hypothetical protein WB562_03005, partial [Candidatus Sulfotelmatobacter sp.]
MASSQSSSQAKVAAIISRPDRAEVARAVPGLLEWFRAHHYQVIVDRETSRFTNGLEVVERSQLSSRPLD